MKWIVLLVLVAGCAVEEKDLTTYEVRCPLTMSESSTDTIRASTYVYGNGSLTFYSHFRQFPGTCVVKELS